MAVNDEFRETLELCEESLSHLKHTEVSAMGKGVNEESERMMLLLQELAVLKKTGSKSLTRTKRRQEISQEMKRLAGQKKKASNSNDSARDSSPNL